MSFAIGRVGMPMNHMRIVVGYIDPYHDLSGASSLLLVSKITSREELAIYRAYYNMYSYSP